MTPRPGQHLPGVATRCQQHKAVTSLSASSSQLLVATRSPLSNKVAPQVALPVREEGGRKGDEHLQFLGCQRQHSRSVAAITSQLSLTVATRCQQLTAVASLSESSSKLLVATNLYKALQVSLPTREEGGREINTKPSLYCSQQSLSQRATP